jgi:hypothetical protein
MTLILVLAFVLIAFIMLLRYDIHKNKYGDGLDKPAEGSKQPAEHTKSNAKKKNEKSS